MKALIGTGVALITPFTKNLEIDETALRNIVERCISNGINYLVVLGTTAETATLTEAEKQRVIDIVVSANKQRLPLVLGVGGNHTQAVINELQTRDLSAFTAILSVSPYYNKPTQEGIFQHFKAVAQASPLPVILYNVPGRTASNMLPDTVIRLATEVENIVAIKEAAGDIVQAMELIRRAPEGFLVISGDDIITLPMVLAGGAGVISVIAQGTPNHFSRMVQLGLERNATESFSIHYQLTDIIHLIFAEGNPAGIKSLLDVLGICEPTVRLPLAEASSALREKISRALAAIP